MPIKALQRFALSLTATLLLTLTNHAPAKADQELNNMIGQMLMLGFQGASAGSPGAKRLAAQIKRGEVGSVVMLGYNFKSKPAVKGLTNLFKSAAGANKVFLAVDMEGGSVQRLGKKLGYPRIASARSTAKRLSPTQAKASFRKLAEISKNAGFNMNLGPVVDLLVNPNNPVIAKWNRAYSKDPQKTADYAAAFVESHNELGVITVLKHFPGHGSSSGDSHHGFVNITKSWTKKELEPFKTLIKAGKAPAIMPGHLVHSQIAKDGVPVSISKPAIQGLLRRDLGYNGLVISDDLQMGAIASNYGYKNTLIRAVNAGVDILMISNSRKPDPNLPRKTIQIIADAVKAGKISRSTIEAAHQRIQTAKNKI